METVQRSPLQNAVIPQEMFFLAGQVSCAAWRKEDYRRVKTGELALWVPFFDGEGVDYSRAFLAPSRSLQVRAFRFHPKAIWTRQMLLLVDLQFLPEGLNYLSKLFGRVQSGDYVWVPFPVNNDLESWFVARDRARSLARKRPKPLCD